jgi:hypothetical protein
LGTVVPIGPDVCIQVDSKGKILLRIRDVLYEPDDTVPIQHLPELKAEKKRDARTVALKFTIHAYGPNRSRWPDLARAFIEMSTDVAAPSTNPTS